MSVNSMDNLKQRSNSFSLVLNDNELNLFKNTDYVFKTIIECDELYVDYLAVIKHDRDFDKEQDHIKTVHYHVVLTLDKCCRLNTLLNKLSDLFKCNFNQISIEKCNSVVMQSRYLIHLDELETEKAVYYPFEVVTNQKDTFDNYIKLQIIKDLKGLVIFVQKHHYDLEDIMVSISNYDKWRKYINDLIINYNRKRY